LHERAAVPQVVEKLAGGEPALTPQALSTSVDGAIVND
jgi:hypothetical protein